MSWRTPDSEYSGWHVAVFRDIPRGDTFDSGRGFVLSFLIMAGQRAWRSRGVKETATEVYSPFISDYIERRERQRDLRAWTAGGDDHATAFARSMTWGGRARPVEEVDVQYQDAAPDGRGGFYYAVNFGRVGGMFHQNATGEERRLFHRDSFVCDGMTFQPGAGRFVAAFGGDHGQTHLALLDENGRQVRWLTEGDCSDARPAWDPARPDVVLYQTSGMARGAGGRIVRAPWEVMELDIEKGETTSLWSREGVDMLLPRRDREGRLYALARPSGGAPVSLLDYAKSVVSIPWVLAQAVFGFANAFAFMFARKPLWKAGGPEERVEAPPAVSILGRQLETAALESGKRKSASGHAALAPESWQLWRRDPDGGEHRLATHVSWFCLGADGTPYYSTGLAIHACRDGGVETVYEGTLMEAFMPLE